MPIGSVAVGLAPGTNGYRSEIMEINPFIMDGDGNTSDTYVNPQIDHQTFYEICDI
jgi:hypothetical protein